MEPNEFNCQPFPLTIPKKTHTHLLFLSFFFCSRFHTLHPLGLVQLAEGTDPPPPYPVAPREHLLLAVYRDLWQKGLYVSRGTGFGGDFLVYPGDPLLFHALYVVQCRDRNSPIHALDMVSFGRVTHGTKKVGVFASISESGDSIDYARIEWVGKS